MNALRKLTEQNRTGRGALLVSALYVINTLTLPGRLTSEPLQLNGLHQRCWSSIAELE